ncbi:caspase domain-containing protein, partial [Bacteroidota bacterium]
LLCTSDDSKINLWNIDDDKLVATFISADETDEITEYLTDTIGNFIVLTPDNYYTCSKGAYKGVAFRIGNRAYPFEQFDLRLNRPDIVMERLGYADQTTIDNMKKAYLLRLKKMGFTQEQLDTTFHLPEIVLKDDIWNYKTDERSVKINLIVKDSIYQLRQLNVFNNNVPIYGTEGKNLVGKNKESKTEFGNKQYYYDTTLTIPLITGDNKLQFSVLNEGGTESLYATRYVTCNDATYKPQLYIVAIGISDYPQEAGLDSLKYADNDADSIVKVFSSQSRFDKESIHVIELKNNEATLDSIKNIKNTLMKTNPEDEVIVHFSGHGILDDSCDFRFANYDILEENPIATGLAYDAMDNLVDGIPALKKVIFIDACHSGEDMTNEYYAYIQSENSDKKKGYIKSEDAKKICFKSLQKVVELQEQLFSDLRRGSGAIVISASRGSQSAYEPTLNEFQNGVFTHFVIEGLMEISNEKGSVRISELMDYVLNKMKDSKYNQTPTFRRENLENDYVIFSK